MNYWLRLLYRALGARQPAASDDLLAEQRLLDAPASELASLSENSFAQIAGTVRPLAHRVLTAPLSGRRCVYWSVSVTEVSGSERHDRGRGIGGEDDRIPFVVDDSTAQAVIDPEHAEISVPYDYPSTSHGASYADLEQLGVLDRLRTLHRDAYRFETKSLRYRECVIEAGHEIVVLGAGMLEADPEANPPGMYRQGPPLRLRFGGTAKQPLVIRAPQK